MTDYVPIVLTGQALRSLRDSGYSLSAAIAEVVDNSLEAKANEIHVRLDEESGRDKRRRIHRISVSDDGEGMDRELLQLYPQIGFSTRYMSSTTIGKYGVGAKLAALNYGERLDVWSRASAEQPWLHVYFDLEEIESAAEDGEELGILPPTQHPVPDDLIGQLPKDSGTLVVWSKIDRLEEGRHAQDANLLRIEVEKELSRIFRYFLDGGIKIKVNDTQLLPHDPLFTMEGTWGDRMLKKHYSRKGVEGPFSAKDHYEPCAVVSDERIRFARHEIRLRVTVYPKEVVRSRGQGGDELATQLRVPENEGALSFVRLEREINYTNVPRILPSGVQTPDRFIGIEIHFSPDMDEMMGVRNVKRGVEPHGELRAAIRSQLAKSIPQARELIQDAWGEASRVSEEANGEHASILEAVKKAERTLPKSRVPRPQAEQERALLEDLARDVGHDDPEDRATYLESLADLPYVIVTVDFPGMSFIDVQHLSDKIIIRVNERHPFYRELWEPIRSIATSPPGSVSGDEAMATARRTVEALTLLIIAYAKAESMDSEPHKFMELRDDWGKFLRSLMGKVKDVL